MRRLFLHINVSLDGYICDAAGDIDWHFAERSFSATSTTYSNQSTA
jgi:hypothetical protein